MSIWNSIRRWWFNQDALDKLQSDYDQLSIESKAREFLLSQAPMIAAPLDRFTPSRSVTKFAYVHPTTLERFGGNCITPGIPWVTFLPSATKWILTPLMPLGSVIYSPNPMPGTEKFLVW